MREIVINKTYTIQKLTERHKTVPTLLLSGISLLNKAYLYKYEELRVGLALYIKHTFI